MEAKLDMVLEQVGRDKNIDKAVLISALEQAILTAAKRTFGMNREMEAKFNAENGGVDLFLIVNVVEEDDAIEGREITVSEAHKAGLEAELGDELLFQVFYRAEEADRASEQDEKFGTLIDLKNAHKKFGRIAAQTAKQVIYQRVREAERDNVFNEFKDRKGELISGIVRRFERGALVVDIGKAEAVLPMREQVPRESYRVGDTIKAYCLDIDRNARGPQVILSRTHKGVLEKLFEQEVPEIYEKIVRIESSAREPGARAKIAVSSRDRDVDPVGACVGMKGSRVQAVVQELRGEKIDIVPYDDDPARFVCNAIAPAEVSRVIIDAEGHRMELIVPDDKLSLAIGKKGQNVRLASQLTGWRIDIHSESKILRARASREGADRQRGRRRGLRRRGRGEPVQARMAVGRRAVARTRRGDGRLAGRRRTRGRQARHRGCEGVHRERRPSQRHREARSGAPHGPHRRSAIDGARRRGRGRARRPALGEHPLARGPHQDADRAGRDVDRHRHGRSRAAPPARDQLAVGGIVLTDAERQPRVPMRTCVTCRALDARGAMVRLALEEGRLVLDRAGVLPGRGAWIHARPACIERLAGPGRGGLARSLRRDISGVDLASVTATLREGCKLSANDDKSGGRGVRWGDRREAFAAGQPGEEAVDMAPRINAKDLRSEDARL